MSKPQPMNSPAGSNPVSLAPRHFVRYLVVYFTASTLLMVPSIFFWSTEPFQLTKNEFDFFLGRVPELLGLDRLTIFFIGKAAHFILFAAVGWAYYRLMVDCDGIFERMDRSHVVLLGTGAALVYLVGLPWVSPDVFYYIAKGWMEARYQLDIYSLALRDSPDFPSSVMYSNVISSFTKWPGNYGPIHQNICATLAGLSGGSVKLAVFLFKALNFVLYLGCAGIAALIARKISAGFNRTFAAYALNPLGLFALVTCAHNDATQNLFLLLALLCVVEQRAALSGAALGLALAYKYVAIALAPALVFYWCFRRSSTTRWRDAAFCVVAMIAAVAGAHLLYPGSIHNMLVTLGGGWSPMRGSIYFVMSPLLEMLLVSNYRPIELTLTVTFVTVGAIICIVPHVMRRQVMPYNLARQWFWIFCTYFLTAMTVVEWYLTWIIGFGLLARDRRYFRAVILLTSAYLPAVIFTIRSGNEVIANAALYLVLLACIGKLVQRICRPDLNADVNPPSDMGMSVEQSRP